MPIEAVKACISRDGDIPATMANALRNALEITSRYAAFLERML